MDFIDYPNNPETREDYKEMDCPRCEGKKGERYFDEDTQLPTFDECKYCDGTGKVQDDEIC